MIDIQSSELPIQLPIGFGEHELKCLLLSAARAGAADVNFASGEHVNCRISGKYRNITTRALQNNEVQAIARIMYGDNIMSILGSAEYADPRYAFRIDRANSIGFRVNITGCLINQDPDSVQITCRALPNLPLSVHDLKLPFEMAKNMFSRQGMVIVAGETGSGKSTLLASVFRAILENSEDHKMLTFEDPIEYTYEKVAKASSNSIYQHELRKHIKTFEEAVKNILRRAPTDGLIGESRDKVTIAVSIQLALTGCKTFTTVHAETCGGTLSRMVQAFDYADQPSTLEKLVNTVRLIVVQRLVRTIDGKQTAINSWIDFDADYKERLIGVKAEKVSQVTDGICELRGTSVGHHAAYKVKQGIISLDAAAHATGLHKSRIESLMTDLNDSLYEYKKEELNGVIV